MARWVEQNGQDTNTPPKYEESQGTGECGCKVKGATGYL